MLQSNARNRFFNHIHLKLTINLSAAWYPNEAIIDVAESPRGNRSRFSIAMQHNGKGRKRATMSDVKIGEKERRTSRNQLSIDGSRIHVSRLRIFQCVLDPLFFSLTSKNRLFRSASFVRRFVKCAHKSDEKRCGRCEEAIVRGEDRLKLSACPKSFFRFAKR